MRKTRRYYELRRALENRRRDIDSSVRDRVFGVGSERSRGAPVDVLDEAEAADAELRADVELAVMQIKLETLNRIDAALARLEVGLYGRCSECGEEISEARLYALPFAVRCISCEEAHETDRAMLERQTASLCEFYRRANGK